MKALTFLFILLLSSSLAPAQSWSDSLRTERAEKDEKFRVPETSPVPDKEIKRFKGLVYFEPDSGYLTEATFHKYPEPSGIIFRTSDSRQPTYLRYGFITFTLKDTLCTLQVYRNPELAKKPAYENYLFLPFTDLTNGEGTYPGGRYLELKIPASDKLIIDFNRSYNPYCAYSDNYSCPVPPEENQLPLRIEAGEKYNPAIRGKHGKKK